MVPHPLSAVRSLHPGSRQVSAGDHETLRQLNQGLHGRLRHCAAPMMLTSAGPFTHAGRAGQTIRLAYATANWVQPGLPGGMSDEPYVVCQDCDDWAGTGAAAPAFNILLPRPAQSQVQNMWDPAIFQGDVIGYMLDQNGERVCVTPYLAEPVGSFRFYVNNIAAPWAPPLNYLECGAPGTIVAQAMYPLLYYRIAATFNTGGEGAGNFRLPECGGRSVIGRVPVVNPVGQLGGFANHGAAAANNHDDHATIDVDRNLDATTQIVLMPSGAPPGEDHTQTDNRPPYLAMFPIIRVL